ncbi:Kinase [Spironucleus salmonicida]|uniref:mitogen-activated protein kinase kinase n=1 Tax=Spironucleus salmonicida TaxID=348837 RepID=V6LW58_9EUKA|nr:Kinase [Spironucleus salmonicida]|eukprot:EST48800.1 Kinase [Spironucleus salmonicida]
MNIQSKVQKVLIPDSVDPKNLIQQLEKLQSISVVLSFSFNIDQNHVTIVNNFYDQTLLDYKEQNQIFVLLEAILIFIKCTLAGYQIAQAGLFFGGYDLDDFIIRQENEKIQIQIKINIERMIKVLSRNKIYTHWDPPELLLGFITEKADFWSLASIFSRLLATDYKLQDLKTQKMTQIQFLQSLSIQNVLIVNTMLKAFEPNPNLRLGYKEFLEINEKHMTPMIKFFNNLPSSHSSSMEEYFEERGFNNYQLIGKGSYGTIYKIVDKNGRVYVVKGILVKNQNQMNIAYSEVFCLFGFAATLNIITIQDVQKLQIGDLTYVILRQDHAYYGDFRQFMKHFQSQLSPNQVLRFFYSISKALYNLKVKGIVHRDVKPDNILVNADFRALLGDFGSNEIVINGTVSQKFVGTIGYIAPEVINSGKISFPIDVWAMGIMLREYVKDCPIINECLIEDPQKRITIERLTYYLSRYQNVEIDVDDTEAREQIESGTSSEVNSNTLQNSYIDIQSGFSFCNIASLKW